jgi:ATP-GRASP peptide maturase of grasp-with-spasm system
MILIISEKNDYSTNLVIEWLNYYKKDLFRLNTEDQVEILNLENDNFIISVNKSVIIEYKNITSVWFRRGNIELKKTIIRENSIIDKYLNFFLKKELFVLEEYLNFLLQKKRCLGNPNLLNLNKLEVLNKAKFFGLLIPEFFVTKSKEELIKKSHKKHQYVTKVLSNVFQFDFFSKPYMTFTEVLKKKFIDNISDVFFPSLCQKLIEKEFDIRIFFIDNKIYSMAIYSQVREDSKIDFRKYNYENPDRKVPIKLNVEIEYKIIKLMNELNLNTGSIDMILCKKGELYFLEVNPIGQYGMLDFPCNYGINMEIAKFLSHES